MVFIKQNKPKWLEIEQTLSGKNTKNPDDLSSMYINLINDLSFAQTYYPKSKTTEYLNQLSVQICQKIYKTKRIERNRLTYFFKVEVPLIAYEYKKYLYFAFILFALFTFFGAISTHYDEDFVRLILGDNYVDMTLENIKDGNPIAVYGTGSNWATSVLIIRNNLFVGANMFFYGVFAGFGTLYILMKNSIMLGSFQYFFQTQGVLGESMRGIWIHGAFEMSAMIVETAAGFILGASVLFPKTYSRLNSFKIGFKKGFKIFISTMPFTFVAGIFEGFVTRHALDMPLWLALFISIGSFAFIFFYYIIYPRIIFKKQLKYADL